MELKQHISRALGHTGPSCRSLLCRVKCRDAEERGQIRLERSLCLNLQFHNTVEFKVLLSTLKPLGFRKATSPEYALNPIWEGFHGKHPQRFWFPQVRNHSPCLRPSQKAKQVRPEGGHPSSLSWAWLQNSPCCFFGKAPEQLGVRTRQLPKGCLWPLTPSSSGLPTAPAPQESPVPL